MIKRIIKGLEIIAVALLNENNEIHTRTFLRSLIVDLVEDYF
jgi:hypothetical protein